MEKLAIVDVIQLLKTGYKKSWFTGVRYMLLLQKYNDHSELWYYTEIFAWIKVIQRIKWKPVDYGKKRICQWMSTCYSVNFSTVFSIRYSFPECNFLSKKNGPYISKCYLVFFLGGSIYSENTKQQILPSFKSRAKVYKEEIGETTVLLCKVNNLGELLLN